jgi:hypothetical protein
MDERMTRQEHLAWAKKRALECCDRGELQHALDSLISDLVKHPETKDVNFPDPFPFMFCWRPDYALNLWMQGKLDTQDKMSAFINSLE